MKKIILTAVLALVGAGAFAQKVANFYPAWYYEAKGGVAYFAGETTFGNLLSPTAELDAAYQFTPTFSLRGGLSGWEAKDMLENANTMYRWNFAQLNVDAMFDILNLFARNKRSDRALNPYFLAGVGANLRFNNAQALDLDEYFKLLYPDAYDKYLWDGSKISLCGRVGLGLGIRLSDAVALTVEVDENFYTDKFNSKVGPNKIDLDYRIAATAGVKFTFGAARKKAAALAAVPAEAPAAAPVAEAEAAAKAAAVEAAKVAAENAAAEAADEAAEQKAAALAAAKAAAERTAARKTSENIFFVIGKSDIREAESTKVARIIEILKTYPEAVVTVSGYADRSTGNPKLNMQLSEKRAENVAKVIEDAGIAKERITVEYFGDTVQPFAIQTDNRVSVCVTK